MPVKYPSMADRIIANSVLLDGIGITQNGEWSPCWIWIAKRQMNKRGNWYGLITVRYKSGKRKGKVHNVFVHRMVLMVFKNRRMTPRMVGCHLCNESLCCNPAHIVGGSQKKNMRQCVNDGRLKTPFVKGNQYGAKKKGAKDSSTASGGYPQNLLVREDRPTDLGET